MTPEARPTREEICNVAIKSGLRPDCAKALANTTFQLTDQRLARLPGYGLILFRHALMGASGDGTTGKFRNGVLDLYASHGITPPKMISYSRGESLEKKFQPV